MSSPNQVSIQFANSGYVLTTITDDDIKTEVFVSTAKLLKAVRGAVDELTLVPKSRKDDAEE